MSSYLTWIDYDSKAYQRSQRILALFSERESRDEMGIGVVRDALSDRLFPGTSTIQTRLRYMFFVPWIYQALERRPPKSHLVAHRAREMECDLTEVIRRYDPDAEGLFGVSAGRELRRLPSSVYWAGLETWGIRLYAGTQSQYHADFDHVVQRRKRAQRHRASASEIGDDLAALWDSRAETWHPGLPKAPSSFPENIDFFLAREEAHFIQESIKRTHPNSLLAYLVFKPERVDVEFPWEHPRYAEFSGENQTVLHHAHMFSLGMYGASLLYNILLLEIRESDELRREHQDRLARWAEEIKTHHSRLTAWRDEMDAFWDTVRSENHRVSLSTQAFVEQWIDHVLQDPETIAKSEGARELVKNREMTKKGRNSRFVNRRALDQWSGKTGLRRMNFRWPIARSYIEDLHDALVVI